MGATESTLPSALNAIVSEAETLTRGRIFGSMLERRLRMAIEPILECAE